MATSRAEIESLSEASAFAWVQAARRAESGIGQILKQEPGFRGYYVFHYVFQDGNGVGCSITLFENRDAALAANEGPCPRPGSRCAMSSLFSASGCAACQH